MRVAADITAASPGESALTILANDVTVDLDGHTLRGAGAASTAAGIHVLGADGAVIRNGTVRGFLYGVRVEPLHKDKVVGVTVDSLVVEACTARGIAVDADRGILRNNIVRDLTHYKRWPGSPTIGIEAIVKTAEITGNLVSQIQSDNPIGLSMPKAARSGSVTDNILVHAGKLVIPDPPKLLKVARNFVHDPPKEPPRPPPCQEVSAPTVIRQSGCVRVVGDIAVTEPGGSALVVQADRVSIDLGGHSLTGPGATSAAPGIHVLGGDDISIRNGNIGGFLFGIRAEPSGSDEIGRLAVQRMIVERGTARGIFAQADVVTIRDNIIRNLTGYTRWEGSYTIGIEIFAQSCEVTGNHLSELYPIEVGESVGIALTEKVRRCSITDNVLANATRPEFGRSIAFWIGMSVRRDPGLAITVERNVVSGFGYAHMADLAPGAIRRNVFAVDCTPDDVGSYGESARHNTFSRARGECRDTLPSLEALAKDGNPVWQVRLAAAYIERQWLKRRDSGGETNCQYLRRAKEILEPLVAANNVAASQQLARLPADLVTCRDQP